MTTALDLIEAAMGKIQMLAAGETVSAEDAALCLKRLNTLMTSLENENLFNYTTTKTVVNLPANTTSLTIGAAQQIAMVRPTKLLKGSFSRLQGIDYDLVPVSEQEYNLISLKSSIGSVAPAVCWFNGGNPTGIVYFWPVAAAQVELHLVSPAPGGVAVDTSTLYDFPPGYQRAVENLLALEIAPDFDTVPNPTIIAMAMTAKRMIKRTNMRIPNLTMDRVNAGYGNSPSDFYGGY